VARKLPPFAAIRAFEAAAQSGSFKAAAEELCLSPSAISHQIRVLEDYLDTRLFVRTPQGVELTHTGGNLAGKLSQLLDGLDAATRAARGSRQDTIRVLSTPGFAARWLVPRLDRFEHGHAVRIRVAEGAPSTEFARDDADIPSRCACVPSSMTTSHSQRP
jgi:LysR family glycine cleavage system transcriptional activator